MQTRLTNGSTDLSNDPSDPDLQILSGLKEKLSTAETDIASSKGVFGANNPKMVAQQTNLVTLRKQIADATEKMRAHLKERIDLAQAQIASLEAEQDKAQKSLIEVQAQRDRLTQLQREVAFRADELNARQRAAEQAKLKSKLTFSDMTVLDKATPPVDPAFPKPFVVMPVGIAAGLALGLVLALLAEAADRTSSLSNRSGACGPGAVLGLSRQRGAHKAAPHWRVTPRPSSRLDQRAALLAAVSRLAASPPQGPRTVRKTIGGNVFCGASSGAADRSNTLRASVHGA